MKDKENNNLNRYISPSGKVVWRVIDNEVMILHREENILYSLTSTAAKIWELMDGRTSLEEIVKAIYEEFDADYEKIKKDVVKFIKTLSDKKMVLLSENHFNIEK